MQSFLIGLQLVDTDQIVASVTGADVKIRRAFTVKICCPHVAGEGRVAQRIVIEPIMDRVRTVLIKIFIKIRAEWPMADPGLIFKIIHGRNELE